MKVTIQQFSEAMEHLKVLQEFAYTHGFHEIGYDAVERVGNYASGLENEVNRLEHEIDTRPVVYLESEGLK